MPPLPVLAGSRVVRALEKIGFKVVRIRGSHHVLRHPDGRGTSVPVHGNQDVRVGTLRSILRDCGLTADDFLDLLDLGSGAHGLPMHLSCLRDIVRRKTSCLVIRRSVRKWRRSRVAMTSVRNSCENRRTVPLQLTPLPPGLITSLSSERGIITKVEVDVALERAIGVERRPASAAHIVALVGALPRELNARPAITIRVATVEFPPLPR